MKAFIITFLITITCLTLSAHDEEKNSMDDVYMTTNMSKEKSNPEQDSQRTPAKSHDDEKTSSDMDEVY